LADAKYGRVQTVDTLHFTGGLRGVRAEGGWRLGPFLRDDRLAELGPVREVDIKATAVELKVHIFGADEAVQLEPHLISRIWRPLVGLEARGKLPADTWANIAHRASEAGDEVYAQLARYLSVCLRASDIRLRDISDGYGTQLLAALAKRTEVGKRFANLPLADIHLAIHSFVAEMGAARDYLAAIVGRQLGAPASKDSLARLVDWLEADARKEQAATPVALALTKSWPEDAKDPWLRQLTAYRNLFLHRGPMGAQGMGSAPSLVAADSSFGEVRSLLLPIPRRDEAEDTIDALTEFVRLHRQMLHLAADLADHSPFPGTPRVVRIE
jgi:hypothetical protein